jgi:hypothetical protein
MKNIKKILLYITLLNFSISIFAQKKNYDSICEDAILIKTDDYEGVILGPKCFNYKSIIILENGDTISGPPPSENMWKPTIKDIEYVEKLIKKFVTKKSKRMLEGQGYGGYPIIYQNFDKYVRQYYGIYNEKGEKILNVDFIWREYAYKMEWKCVHLMISDGGSYFWQISVNMKKKKCFNYSVNGIG